jgi:hypothetical protein
MAESTNGPPATDPASGTIVVRQSRLQRDGLFGTLIAVFGLALARGYTGAHTSTGRIAVAVFVCTVTAALIWGWAG